MTEWILIAVLYVLVLGLFRFLGGFAAAGEAARQWGQHEAALPCDPSSRG